MIKLNTLSCKRKKIKATSAQMSTSYIMGNSRERWPHANHCVTLEPRVGASTIASKKHLALQDLEEGKKLYHFKKYDYIIGKQKLDTLLNKKIQ